MPKKYNQVQNNQNLCIFCFPISQKTIDPQKLIFTCLSINIISLFVLNLQLNQISSFGFMDKTSLIIIKRVHIDYKDKYLADLGKYFITILVNFGILSF